MGVLTECVEEKKAVRMVQVDQGPPMPGYPWYDPLSDWTARKLNADPPGSPPFVNPNGQACPNRRPIRGKAYLGNAGTVGTVSIRVPVMSW
jgi:hypothetical protein